MVADFFARLAAMLCVAAAVLAAMGMVSALTGCTTPPITIPLISQERFGSVSAYGVARYNPPAALDAWAPDSGTLPKE